MTRARLWWRGLDKASQAVLALGGVWTVLGPLLLALLGFVGLPDRLDALETWRESQERVSAYLVCRAAAEDRGHDARACESWLTPDLLDYLRPR